MKKDKLPEFCYSSLPSTGETILIKKGEKGYWTSKNQSPADELNKMLGVTKAQAEAMLAGSLFGFDAPAANPDTYDENGTPLKKDVQKRRFIDYLKMTDNLDCELIIGNVDMLASFVWDDECRITEAAYKKFQSIMDADYKVFSNGNIEIFCDDERLGEQFTMAIAGYVSEEQYNKWFTGKWYTGN